MLDFLKLLHSSLIFDLTVHKALQFQHEREQCYSSNGLPDERKMIWIHWNHKTLDSFYYFERAPPDLGKSMIDHQGFFDLCLLLFWFGFGLRSGPCLSFLHELYHWCQDSHDFVGQMSYLGTRWSSVSSHDLELLALHSTFLDHNFPLLYYLYYYWWSLYQKPIGYWIHYQMYLVSLQSLLLDSRLASSIFLNGHRMCLVQ